MAKKIRVPAPKGAELKPEKPINIKIKAIKKSFDDDMTPDWLKQRDRLRKIASGDKSIKVENALKSVSKFNKKK